MNESVGPPGAIQILLHYHCMVDPYPHPSRFHTETVDRFHKLGLLDSGPMGRPYTTDKGNFLVGMLCSTPIPEERFVDPRQKPNCSSKGWMDF